MDERGNDSDSMTGSVCRMFRVSAACLRSCAGVGQWNRGVVTSKAFFKSSQMTGLHSTEMSPVRIRPGHPMQRTNRTS